MSSISSMVTGMMTPPPSPCTTRRPTSSQTLLTRLHSTALPVNTARPRMYSSRAPSVRLAQPTSGITTALAIMNAVTTQRMVTTSTPKSLIMMGMTMLITWTLRTLM